MAAELKGHHIGGWLVHDYLGNGFSAVVVSAEKDGQPAALKIIDPEMVERSGEKNQLARIMAEKALAGHGHPHLVDIFDGGRCDVTSYLHVAMEKLDPRTLGKVKRKLPRDNIGKLIGQLAQAAQFLEERGLAHRDIKPDNIFVDAEYSVVKLLDLGVIHPPNSPDGHGAGTGDRFVGTARYSPPEFLYREEEDTPECWRAVTFYQIGATLYDLLMRRQIFEDYKEPAARLYRAVRETVLVFECEDAEPWLVDLARRCLHKDWRVRNELVGWEDFQGPRSPQESGETIRDRLKRRIEANSSHAVQTSKSKALPLRRTMNQLGGAIATMARELCHQGSVFPPVEIKHDVDGVKCSISLKTGPSAQHDLAAVLHIQLIAEALDSEATQIRLKVGARLAADPENNSLQGLFVGEPLADGLRANLDTYLHAALESALGTGNPPASGLSVRPNVSES
jgi:serine/threonine protein kinase